jgi:DNA-binding Lrp family transcriptional regulator
MTKSHISTLTVLERRILGLCMTELDLEAAHLAKVIGAKVHSVRYALERLRERKIIFPLLIVDSTPLGYFEVALFFSCRGLSVTARGKMLKALQAHPNVRVITEVGGSFEYLVEFHLRQIGEASAFLQWFSTITEQRLGYRTPSIRLERRYHGRRYHGRRYLLDGPLRSQVKDFVLPGGDKPFELSSEDQKLIATLQRAPLMSHRELARTTGLPERTVGNRLKRLRDKGVIVGVMLGISWERLPIYPFRILMTLRHHSEEARHSIDRFIAQCPNVIMSFIGFGAWDIELRCEVERPEEMGEIQAMFSAACGDLVENLQIIPAFRNHKVVYGGFLAP